MQKRKVLIGIINILTFAAISITFVVFHWKFVKDAQNETALQIGQSIEASLPKSDIKMLKASPDDISKPQYQSLKKSLGEIIRINPNARFAYIFIEKNGEIYFLADSEPEDSEDYSPPGQEYTKAKQEDRQPFIDGECHMTESLQDRWGTWRTVYVPIKDDTTNKTIAVFGMDYDAKFWQGHLLNQIINASILFIFLLILLVLFKIRTNYKSLRVNNDELKLAQIALKESKEKYETIAQSTLDVIFIVDKFGKQLFFNESIEKVLGYQVVELIGRSFTEFVPKSELQKYLAQLNNVFINKELRNFETKIYHKDGHLVDVEINGKLIKQNGEFVGQGTIIDITDRKKSEQEIKLKNDELAKLNSEKDKLFSIIAHDLRSPFNSFLGLTEFLSEELSTLSLPEIEEYLRNMNKTANNLYKLIENLLDWARMQQGQIPFLPVKIQLSQLVEDNSELVSESAKSKRICISNQIPDNLEIFADKNMLQSVIRNLISNAIKFTPIGGVISISAKKDKNGESVISVLDSGIGMSSNQIDNLFQMDFKQNRKGTEGEPSTGLGLMLCKEFIEKHGGKIWVESKVNNGSTFYFTIPVLVELKELPKTN